MRRERPEHTLQPTALVNEAYLRLFKEREVRWEDRGHFFGIAARVMRQILVDHARKHLAAKRGAGNRSVEFDESRIATDRPQELVALGDALEELVRIDERKARVTALHYFGGLTHDEIATACGIHANTVSRELHRSAAWLRGRFES